MNDARKILYHSDGLRDLRELCRRNKTNKIEEEQKTNERRWSTFRESSSICHMRLYYLFIYLAPWIGSRKGNESINKNNWFYCNVPIGIKGKLSISNESMDTGKIVVNQLRFIIVQGYKRRRFHLLNFQGSWIRCSWQMYYLVSWCLNTDKFSWEDWSFFNKGALLLQKSI